MQSIITDNLVSEDGEKNQASVRMQGIIATRLSYYVASSFQPFSKLAMILFLQRELVFDIMLVMRLPFTKVHNQL